MIRKHPLEEIWSWLARVACGLELTLSCGEGRYHSWVTSTLSGCLIGYSSGQLPWSLVPKTASGGSLQLAICFNPQRDYLLSYFSSCSWAHAWPSFQICRGALCNSCLVGGEFSAVPEEPCKEVCVALSHAAWFQQCYLSHKTTNAKITYKCIKAPKPLSTR